MSKRWLRLIAVAAVASFPLVAGASAQDSGALCDQLAGNPDDPDLPGAAGVKGVIWELIGDGADAACRRAVADRPAEVDETPAAHRLRVLQHRARLVHDVAAERREPRQERLAIADPRLDTAAASRSLQQRAQSLRNARRTAWTDRMPRDAR